MIYIIIPVTCFLCLYLINYVTSYIIRNWGGQEMAGNHRRWPPRPGPRTDFWRCHRRSWTCSHLSSRLTGLGWKVGTIMISKRISKEQRHSSENMKFRNIEVQWTCYWIEGTLIRLSSALLFVNFSSFDSSNNFWQTAEGPIREMTLIEFDQLTGNVLRQCGNDM